MYGLVGNNEAVKFVTPRFDFWLGLRCKNSILILAKDLLLNRKKMKLAWLMDFKLVAHPLWPRLDNTIPT